MTAVTGSVTDLVGNDVENFILFARPSRAFFSGSTLITNQAMVFRPASGSFNFSLPETTTNQVLVSFSATYTGNGVLNQIVFQPTYIPDQTSIALNDLLTVLV